MSDTVPTPDIEDVLSSIRRLVSHDGGRKTRADGDAKGEEDQQAKLVLTPALRVESDHDDHGNAADAAQEETSLMEDTEAADLMSPDVPLAFTSARAARQKASEAGQEQQEQKQEPALVLEHPVELADGGDHRDQQEHAQDTPAESSQDDVASSSDAESALNPTVTVATHESLTAKIAALEEVIGREPDQWEPESEGLGDNAGTDVDALPWEDHVDEHAQDDGTVEEHVAQDTTDADVPDADKSDADTEADLADMGETILDEAMLRDLVSNIVREELQGALGERITRNVRKLVRREIHRAMSAQDFN